MSPVGCSYPLQLGVTHLPLPGGPGGLPRATPLWPGDCKLGWSPPGPHWAQWPHSQVLSFHLESLPKKKVQAKRKGARFPLFFNKMPLAVCEAALCQLQRLGADEYFSHLGTGERLSGPVPVSNFFCPYAAVLLNPLPTPPQPFPPRPHPDSAHPSWSSPAGQGGPHIPALDSLTGGVT